MRLFSMNQDFYNSNSSGFDQYQLPQFPVNYPPQETSKEILQAQEDLMEAIEAFLKEYGHIPPNEKCMALLLADERFLKIKQTMEEEQNQPEVFQELILKLMNDLQILKGIQLEKEKQVALGFIPYWNSSMIDDEEARDNFLKDVYIFLRKFSRIPFGITPKVILIAWESFGKIKDALMDKQYQQEDIQELMSKLLEDVRNISKEPKAITPDEPSEEPEYSLSMGDEHLSTIPEKEESNVENLIPTPSESEVTSDFESKCDLPINDESSPIFTIFSNPLVESNYDFSSSDDESFSEEDIPKDEFKIYSNPLFELDDEIISSELSNKGLDDTKSVSPGINLLNTEFDLIESLLNQDNSIYSKIDFLLKEFAGELAPINPISPGIIKANFDPEEEIRLVENLFDSLMEEIDLFLASDDSMPPGIEDDDYDSEGDIRFLDELLSNDSPPLPENESSNLDHFNDPSFPRPPLEPPDDEICLNFKSDTPVINNFDEFNKDECFDPGG
ncbi:hypothetical protein Tco_0539305 [Tanacetum coccineum]